MFIAFISLSKRPFGDFLHFYQAFECKIQGTVEIHVVICLAQSGNSRVADPAGGARARATSRDGSAGGDEWWMVVTY